LNELDESIKLRSLGRLMLSKHPMVVQIRDQLNHNNFLNPKTIIKSDSYLTKSLSILAKVRSRGIKDPRLEGNRTINGLLKNIPIKDLLNSNGLNSLNYFRIRARGLSKLGELAQDDLSNLERFFTDRSVYPVLEKALRNQDWIPNANGSNVIPGKGKLYELSKLSSKEIRQITKLEEPTCLFKAGIILTPNESINYFNKLAKLTSVAHKSILLRVLHGDIYTNEKLFRFGMRDSPRCSRCDLDDTLEHRLNVCPRVLSLTEKLTTMTSKIGNRADRLNADQKEKLLACFKDVDIATLTVHAEIIKLIVGKSELINPEATLQRTVQALIQKESNVAVKNQLMNLLQHA